MSSLSAKRVADIYLAFQYQDIAVNAERIICVDIMRIILKYGFPRAIFCDINIHRGPQVKMFHKQGQEDTL
jgi:hypothetical protein